MTLRRVTVTSVNWEEKTMDAVDLIDDLEHFDIKLGMGSIFKRPAIDSLALVAMIGKEAVDTILIDAVSLDEIEITDKTGFKLSLKEGKMTINGDQFSGIVKAPELKKQVDKNTAVLKAIQDAITQWVTVPNDGGAAFRGLLSAVPGMQRADLGNIENENIKHG